MKLDLDYPPDLNVRYGYDKPDSIAMEKLIAPGLSGYRDFVQTAAKYRDHFAEISYGKPADPEQPFWRNGWFPFLDGIALYTFIAERKPKTVLEIGSGNSTKFARKAIRDLDLDTRIVSIDPQPRVEVDGISDVVIRNPLEQADLSIFAELERTDIVFFDGSHRCFQNSDVAVFFVDVLPNLQSGTLVGIHDIFWPRDYPAAWKDRLYNEQYMLAAYLLGAGGRAKVVQPNNYCARHCRDEIHEMMPPEILNKALEDVGFVGGTCFFFEAA